ncbi:14677_t:CDS:1 [Acaulospora morrowiae]|uniref:14677_t:CDS:1 n=1 Tax=Acaulospora morrowiae TaxID=94023 RepID=A0A9N8WQY3_9GLOM|nr:14677_t:CDS:1 [Acaulospora morrowiae]
MIKPTSSPCGDKSVSSITTHYTIGQLINIEWEVNNACEKQFYVDLSIIGKDSNFKTIGALLNRADNVGEISQASIKLPENVECDNCTLRLRCAENSSCASIRISRSGNVRYDKRNYDFQHGMSMRNPNSKIGDEIGLYKKYEKRNLNGEIGLYKKHYTGSNPNNKEITLDASNLRYKKRNPDSDLDGEVGLGNNGSGYTDRNSNSDIDNKADNEPGYTNRNPGGNRDESGDRSPGSTSRNPGFATGNKIEYKKRNLDSDLDDRVGLEINSLGYKRRDPTSDLGFKKRNSDIEDEIGFEVSGLGFKKRNSDIDDEVGFEVSGLGFKKRNSDVDDEIGFEVSGLGFKKRNSDIDDEVGFEVSGLGFKKA